MRVAVIADTHVPGRARDLPPSAWRIVRDCDAVIHAGDVVTPWLLDRLRAASPQVHAVLGNNDLPLRGALPERLELSLGGISVAVVHDSGAADGRRARLRRMFPQARAVVFGHSHTPVCDDDGELLLLNPGSPTDRRRQPHFTMATLDCSDGRCSAAIVDLGLERASSRARAYDAGSGAGGGSGDVAAAGSGSVSPGSRRNGGYSSRISST